MPLIKYFFPKDVLAFYSKRPVDFHFDKSTPVFNASQRKYLRKHAGLDIERCFNIKQVHGNRIIFATKRGFKNPKRILRADGILTKERGIPLAVRTADCANIFLYDGKKEVLGILHAGWRSTKKRIAEKAIRLMREKYKSNPRDIKAALGPCIRVCCCEVGEKFKKFFPKEVKKIGGRLYFDLAAANKHQLVKAGVRPRNIRDCSICTVCDKRYFSYRRDGEKAGRFISLMSAHDD